MNIFDTTKKGHEITDKTIDYYGKCDGFWIRATPAEIEAIERLRMQDHTIETTFNKIRSQQKMKTAQISWSQEVKEHQFNDNVILLNFHRKTNRKKTWKNKEGWLPKLKLKTSIGSGINQRHGIFDENIKESC